MLTCCVLAFFGVSLLSLTVNSLEMSSSADIGRSEFNIFGLPFVWLIPKAGYALVLKWGEAFMAH